GADNGHDAAEQDPPADEGGDHVQGRIGPDDDSNADAGLEQSEGDGPAAHGPVEGEAQHVEHAAHDEQHAEEDGEVAERPVDEQDDPACDNAYDAAQEQYPPAAAHGPDELTTPRLRSQWIGDEHADLLGTGVFTMSQVRGRMHPAVTCVFA